MVGGVDDGWWGVMMGGGDDRCTTYRWATYDITSTLLAPVCFFVFFY